MKDSSNTRNEIARIRRVSDMLCTANAGLRDRLLRRAMALDISILFLSSWLVALSFVDPGIAIQLTPFDLDARMWIGFLALCTFLLTLLQLKVDWKGRADGHKRTVEMYGEVKQEAGHMLRASSFDEASVRHVMARYNMAIAVGTVLPEKDFLRQKGRHLRKVELSKHLDCHLSASVLLLKIKFWWKDNVGRDRNDKS